MGGPEHASVVPLVLKIAVCLLRVRENIARFFSSAARERERERESGGVDARRQKRERETKNVYIYIYIYIYILYTHTHTHTALFFQSISIYPAKHSTHSPIYLCIIFNTYNLLKKFHPRLSLFTSTFQSTPKNP